MVIKMEDKMNNSIIKNALLFEKEIFGLALPIYARRLKEFEKNYGMNSAEFYQKFENGELGDNQEWFDWLFEYKSYRHLKERLEAMESIA